jgi:hypothetical protein
MASRKLIVEIVADDRVLQQAFTRSSRSTVGFEKDVGHATRGALAGTGVFRSFGRSIAFASAGFLAFASVGQLLRKSIDATETTEKAFRSLSAQAKAAGTTTADVFGKIAKLQGPAIQLGFNTADLEQGFTILLRGSGSARKAFAEMAAAEDVARAKGVSLAEGAFIVNRALISSGNSARSLGIHFPKAATEAEKLAIILQRFGGQAKANTTQFDVFRAALFNTEQIIGAGILPTLNRYLASGAKWLTQMEQSGRLQRDVNRITKDFTATVSTVDRVVKGVDRVTGSFTNTLRDLAGVWVLLKARALLAAAGLKAVAGAEVLIGESAVVSRIAAYTGAIGTLGATAATASGEVAGLAGLLGKAAAFAPFLLTLGSRGESQKGQPPGSVRGKGGAFVDPRTGHFVATFNGRTIDFGPAPTTGGGLEPVQTAANNPFEIGGRLNTLTRIRQEVAQRAAAVAQRTPISLQGQFNIDELKLANAERVNNQKLVRSILVTEAAILLKQEDSAKKLKDRTAFAQKLAAIMDQIRGIDTSDAAAAKQAADAAKQKRDAERQALLDKLQQGVTVAQETPGIADDLRRLKALRDEIVKQLSTDRQNLTLQQQLRDVKTQIADTRQFAALGLDVTGSPLVPSTKALRAELGNVSKAIEGTFLDTKHEQSVLSKIRRVLSGGLGAVAKDVRATVKQMLDDLNRQLEQNATGPLTKFQKANTAKLVAGLGLDPATERALRARLSQLGAGGTVPAKGIGAFGVVVPASQQGDIVVEHTTVLDGRPIERSVTRHQQKRKRRNPSQVRGPHAGGGL